jgi:hypothetical protein
VLVLELGAGHDELAVDSDVEGEGERDEERLR